jgi:hypothetical protein
MKFRAGWQDLWLVRPTAAQRRPIRALKPCIPIAGDRRGRHRSREILLAARAATVVRWQGHHQLRCRLGNWRGRRSVGCYVIRGHRIECARHPAGRRQTKELHVASCGAQPCVHWSARRGVSSLVHTHRGKPRQGRTVAPPAAALIRLVWRRWRTPFRGGAVHHPQLDRVGDARLLRRLIPASPHSKPTRIRVSDTIRIGYADTLFPKKHQYGDTDTIFLIKIKT